MAVVLHEQLNSFEGKNMYAYISERSSDEEVEKEFK